MKRRSCLKTMVAMSAAGALPALAESGSKSIQLHVDLSVDPKKEGEMLRFFHSQFAPAAAKQPGFLDAKILKLRKALQGSAPAGANYRFLLRFQTEEQRQKWVATAIHQKLWPVIEGALLSKDYTVLLFDVA